MWERISLCIRRKSINSPITCRDPREVSPSWENASTLVISKRICFNSKSTRINRYWEKLTKTRLNNIRSSSLKFQLTLTTLSLLSYLGRRRDLWSVLDHSLLLKFLTTTILSDLDSSWCLLLLMYFCNSEINSQALNHWSSWTGLSNTELPREDWSLTFPNWIANWSPTTEIL